ncbi:MAG: replicative DNA helicase [Candidatus Glassbacteria bacterium]|nr:replicative DNA helicase [Candidatus Glassbacteria bacterium]
MAEQLDRKIPFAQDAEASVLGAMLMDREAIGTVVQMLDPGCFYLEPHRLLFTAIMALYEKSVEVDPVTLSDQLKKDGALEEVGGLQFIYDIAGSVPTAANITFHARIVREKTMLRKLIESCTAIIQESYTPVEDVDNLIDKAEERIFNIQDFRLQDGFSSVKDLIHDIINDLEIRSQSKDSMTGVPTGFVDLDHLTVGLQPSDLIIIAGRPSMGKTAFSLNVALSLAMGTAEHPEPVPVAVFSLEMSKTQIVQRMLCTLARVNNNRMRRAKLTDLEWHNLNKAANRLFEAPIYIDDTPAMSVLEMRAKARRLFKQEGIGLLIVDYMQLMRTTGRIESRQQEVSLISRSLKALAKELNVPVMAMSQLSRAVEGRTDQKPKLADLRESGAIEQDADMVIFIFRPEEADIPDLDGQSTEGLALILLEKNRNGPTGKVELNFIKEFTRFENRSRRQELEQGT